MARCGFIKASGERCKGTATGPHGLCWAHAPENAAQRRRGAVRGGKAKANREIRDLKDQLATLAEGVLAGHVDRGDAAVVNQIINTRARLVEIERKVKETEELEARLEALERDAGQRKGGQRWGA